MNAVGLSVKALCKAGFARTLLKVTRGAPTILMYHGVDGDHGRDGLTDCSGKHVDAALFRQQLEFLAASSTVVPLAKLVSAVRAGESHRRLVAITFDDGFLNNASCAAPLLAEFGFTATIFLATGFIGTNRWMWTDRLESALHRTAKADFRPVLLGESLALSNVAARRHALQRLKANLKTLHWHEAETHVANLEHELEVDSIPPWGLYRFMAWDDVRRLRDAGFEIGAHTVNHAILSKVPAAEAELEILSSRDHIVRELGECSTTFCYPNGKRSDYTAQVRDFCSRHFGATLSAIKGPARGTDMFDLRRLAIDNATSAPMLASMLAQIGYE